MESQEHRMNEVTRGLESEEWVKGLQEEWIMEPQVKWMNGITSGVDEWSHKRS
jgi:hypothetical protein